jgi:hypothetical protein
MYQDFGRCISVREAVMSKDVILYKKKTPWTINKTVEEGLGLRSDAPGIELVQCKTHDNKYIHVTESSLESHMSSCSPSRHIRHRLRNSCSQEPA